MIFGFLFALGFAVSFLLRLKSNLQKLVGASVVTSILVFYLLNANFYPQLLGYQAGNQMAFDTKGRIDPKSVYFWPTMYSHSFNFYTSETRKEFHDSLLQKQGPIWIATNPAGLEELKQRGLPVMQTFEHVDYEITTMQLPFIDPATRKNELTKMLLVRVK